MKTEESRSIATFSTHRIVFLRFRTNRVVIVILLALGCGSGERLQVNPSSEIGHDGPARSASDAELPSNFRRTASTHDWFEDVTERTGVQFRYHNGRDAGRYTILETVGGGVALIDFDRDGDVDLFCTGGGTIESDSNVVSGLPSALFRNEGNFRFVDVTQSAGLAEAGDYSHGCAVCDFDRDGYPDLFVTCYGRSRLYHNETTGRFADVTDAAGLSFRAWSTAACWGDVDRDGWPDLFVSAYLDWIPEFDEFCGDRRKNIRESCLPQNYPPAQDRLFRNRGDGTFEEITQSAKLSIRERGLGVLAADIDEDGWIDFYVANDAGPNQLYLGRPGGSFQEVGVRAGVATNEFGVPEGSMGVDFGDFNGDGKGDLWVTNFEMEDNSLYRNDGRGLFSHATVTAGLGGRCRPYVSFGTGFADFDSDGWLDLFVVNGHVLYRQGQSSYLQPAFLFQNDNGKMFRDVTHNAGIWFGALHAARGAAVGDLDNDGAIDLVVTAQNEPVAVLRNRKTPDNWVRIQLHGTRSGPHAIGAVLWTTYTGNRLVRHVKNGSGYLSHFDSRILFPVVKGQESVDVSVRWTANSDVEVYRDLAVRHTNELVEGKGSRGSR